MLLRICNDIDFGLEHPRLIIHEVYQRDDFAKHVKKIKPHIGAVLSIWNETWCHTLTELWSVGLPVIVTDFPTVSQRVLSSGGGWVVDNQSALEIFHFIKSLLLDSTAISNKVEKVKALQSGSLLELNNHFMAKKYLGLY